MTTKRATVEEPTVLAGAVLPVIEALRALGASDGVLLELDGAQADTRLPLALLVRVERRAAALTGRPSVGLDVGALCAGDTESRSGIVGQLARHCRTLGEAIETAVRTANALSVGERLALHQSGAWAAFSFERCNPLHRTVFGAEVALAQFCRLLRDMASEAGALRVDFAHAAPDYAGRYAEIFGPCVRFGQKANRIRFARELLARPLRLADPYLSGMLAHRADQLAQEAASLASVAQALESYIVARLPEGAPNAAQAALALGMSQSTLYRRLREEGTSFRRLLDRMRQELVAQPGTAPATRERLAQQLGYANVRSLSHALKRWKA